MLRRQRGVALFRHDDGAHQRAAQAVVQVVGDLQPFAQPGIGHFQLVLPAQGVREFLAGLVDVLGQFAVEPLDAPEGGGEAPGQDQGHAYHHQRSGGGRIAVHVVDDAQERQHVVRDGHQEAQHAGGQEQVFGAARAQGVQLELHAGSDEYAGIPHRHEIEHDLGLNRPQRQQCRAHRARDGPERLFQAGEALAAETPGEHREGAAVDGEDEGDPGGPAVRGGERPGRRDDRVQAEQQPGQRSQCIPPIGLLIAPQEPDHQEEAAQRDGDDQVDLREDAPQQPFPFVERTDFVGWADVYPTQTGTVEVVAHRLEPQDVGAGMQRRRRQQGIARHVPAARQGFGQAVVRPERIVVDASRAGHRQVFEEGGHGLAGAVRPFDAIPDRAVMAGPARRPDVGQGDGLPARGGRRVRGFVRARGADGGNRRTAGVRADRVRQAQPEGQDYSKPSERASWIARVRDVTASFR